MQIGRVAQRTELSIATLRHYDEVGLVAPSARSDGGFRLYTEDDVQRLLVIRRMKPLEFTLDEMKNLLASLDTLANPNASTTDKSAASDFIRNCHTRAEESVLRLRRRLGYAEELTELLGKAAFQSNLEP
jgi:DNA-binding transcriptional MerR regulator